MSDEPNLSEAKANSLLTCWRTINPGGRTIQGRDSKIMKEQLDKGHTAIQLLWAMVLYSDTGLAPNVWTWQNHDDAGGWFNTDHVTAGVELLLWLGEELPEGYYTYQDYKDGGTLRAEQELEFKVAEQYLEEWIDDRLVEYTIDRGTRLDISVPARRRQPLDGFALRD